MVRRKLHDERSGFACKCLKFLQYDTGNDNGSDSDKVGRYADCCRSSEQSAGNESDDRKLGSARNESRCHDGHLAVAVILNRTGCHDTRNTAAGRYQDRDKALSGETELAEDPVHNESDAGHITDILNDSQQQEEDQHLRDKAEDRADTGDNTILNEAVEPCTFSYADGSEDRVEEAGDPFTEDDVICKVRCPGADRYRPASHSNRVYKEHDSCKYRKTENSVRDDFVDSVGSCHIVT